MIIQSLFYIPTIIALLALAVLIFTNNKQESVNRIFALFLVVVALWLVPSYIADILSKQSETLFAVRTINIINPFLAFLFLIFTLYFPYKTYFSRWLVFVLLIPCIFHSLFAFSGNYIKTIDNSGVSALPIDTGYIFMTYTVYNLVYFSAAFIILLTKLRHGNPMQKYQIKLVNFALLLTIIINVGYIGLENYLPEDSILQLMYIPTIFVSVVLTTLAVLEHRLFTKKDSSTSAIIRVSNFITKKADATRGLYEMQSFMYLSDSKNIALDFTGVTHLDPAIINSINNIKQNALREGKKLYFIRYQKNLLI